MADRHTLREERPAAASHDIPPFQWRDLVNVHTLLFSVAIAAAYATLVVLLAGVMLTPTGKDDQYIVVMPPWEESARAFEMTAALDARVLNFNIKSNAYLLYLKRPDAVDALHRAGAWLVLDPAKVGGALGCGPPPPRRESRARALTAPRSAVSIP